MKDKRILVIIASIALIIVFGWVLFGQSNESDSALILSRQQYIDRYISSINFENYTAFGNTLYSRGYLTTTLYNTTESLINNYTAGDFSSSPAYSTLICVSQIPKSYSYGTAKVSADGNSATLPVNVYDQNSTPPVSYTADWVNANGSWKLNNAACS